MLTFTPFEQGNVKQQYRADHYLICKSKFGWVAYAHWNTKKQQLLTTIDSANSKTGAIQDCLAHHSEH